MASDAGNHISTVIRQILSRTLSETIVSYAGTSQYSVGGAGTAACGLAALNFARVVFEHDQHRTSLGDPLVFVCKVLSRETIQNAISICSAWSSDLHMEVEEIFNVPLFNTCMKLCSTKYGTPGLSQFRGLLSDLTRLDSSAAAIITRPPEILACVTLKLSRAAHVFLVFDSHPREKYPDGSGITITCSVEIAARCLSQLFPVISLPDSGLDWQAQLLSNYSGHIFTPRAVDDRSAYLTQVAIESSIRLLSLRATVASLTSRNAMLERENESLESQVQGLEGELRDRKSKIKTQRPRSPNPSSKSSINQQSRPGPSSTSPRSSPSSSSSHRGSTSPEPHTPSSDSDTDMSGYSAAIRQQRFYDAEDEVLREEQRQLVRTSQKTFDCGICFDSYPEDVVLRVDACGHGYCRDCMKGVITSKIDEHRYPIFCPTCSVARTPQSAEPAEITEDLIVCVDLEERQFAVWNEMQMAKFSILLHCRKCSQSFFADKMDHDEINIIACPVRACRHVWCKDCQQTIEMGSGPRHSCDGSSELDHLVRTQGWKYCPTCRTPVQKIVGCNHMTCITPGCNTHFCYLCGGLIVQSALQAEIRSATSAHYRRCQLFEIPR